MLNRKEFKGKIEFDNVCFNYPLNPDLKVLKNLSVTFEAGQTIGLIGPSGSGKSTIIQLLERYYDPTSGVVKVDGIDLKKINLTSYRRLVGYVGQEPVLFNTSIEENMRLAKPDATEDEMIEALIAANAWKFIKTKLSKTGLKT